MIEYPERIYLEPWESADPYTGQTWCEDDGNWIGENGDYVAGQEYIRADLVEELKEKAWKYDELSK